tara:strand:+ start:988 stop:2556 length:1569 start_codon:yes stop_codon:yes gene_type:complete
MRLKNINLFIIIIIIFSLIKIDYRFEEIPYGLEVDDAEYYYSAITIGLDYDLDFSNQMEGIENRFLNKEIKKVVPFHPIGSGMLAAPFVFVGNIIQKLQNSNGLISFVYFMYSIAPIFYLLLSILLIQKSMKSLNISFNNNLLLLAIFGTGISYYSFDRFSMSHVYEFFASTFLIYLTTYSIKKDNSSIKRYIHFLIGLLIFIFLAIRWTNYLFFLIPMVVYLISKSPIRNLYLSPYFIFGISIGLIIFLLHTKYLYGIYTLNQAPIVLSVENSFSENYNRFFDLSLFSENIIFLLEGLRIIFLSQEFGLFFFAPILFLSIVFVLFSIYEKKFILGFCLSILYSIPFISVIVIQNTAFSYGYRYLFVLIPINIILYFKFLNNSKIIKCYLYFFSILGFALYIFFETTQGTSLSNGYVVNAFGMETRYSNPAYLSNLPSALLSINAYMHIIFTSFLGVFLIKCINLIASPLLIFGKFTEINDDIFNLVDDTTNFSWFKLSILFVFVIYFLLKVTKEESISENY